MQTPRELIDKVVFGGLYKVKFGTWPMGSNGWMVNDQCYGLAVPVMDGEGKLWMQDTYQLPFPHYNSDKDGVDNKTDAAILQICSFGEGYNGWCVRNARCDYYYKNQMLIMTEDDLSHFELICDLHDYRWIGYENYRDYMPEDIIHNCPLYFEHGYSWDSGRAKGGILVRKGAKRNSVQMLERAISDVMSDLCWPSWAGEYMTNSLDVEERKCIENGGITDKLAEKVRIVRTLNGKLKEMEDEFGKLYRSLVYDEDGKDKLSMKT